MLTYLYAHKTRKRVFHVERNVDMWKILWAKTGSTWNFIIELKYVSQV